MLLVAITSPCGEEPAKSSMGGATPKHSTKELDTKVARRIEQKILPSTSSSCASHSSSSSSSFSDSSDSDVSPKKTKVGR